MAIDISFGVVALHNIESSILLQLHFPIFSFLLSPKVKRYRFCLLCHYCYILQVKQRASGHGIGRKKEEDVNKIAFSNLTTLSDYLGDKQFMMGDKITKVLNKIALRNSLEK